MRALEFFRSERNISLKKPIPVKPANLREKQKQVEPVSFDEEFTFFETLGDPAMNKFIGLDGNMVEPETDSRNRASASTSSASKEPILSPRESVSPSKEPAVEKKPAPAPATVEPVKREVGALSALRRGVGVTSAGYAVQVSSFRERKLARALEEKLTKKGYPVFLTAVRIPGKDEVWHRVFIGRYADKQTALNTAYKVKEMEHLNAVVLWQDVSKR